MWTFICICHLYEKDRLCNFKKQFVLKFLGCSASSYWEKWLESELLKWKNGKCFWVFSSHRWKDLNNKLDYRKDGFRPLSSNTKHVLLLSWGLSTCGLPAIPQWEPFTFLWKSVSQSVPTTLHQAVLSCARCLCCLMHAVHVCWYLLTTGNRVILVTKGNTDPCQCSEMVSVLGEGGFVVCLLC